ncbi:MULTISPECIES: hypothetical protein [unclassified Streptomyces]|uniref:hypothetical protein n=1 Tax=unclassified Streptomyces TaxID=2593676 RepID=UPI0036E6D81D
MSSSVPSRPAEENVEPLPADNNCPPVGADQDHGRTTEGADADAAPPAAAEPLDGYEPL